MTEKYRPSSGTEGEDFIEAFCDCCTKDAKYRKTGDSDDSCPIVANTLMFDVTNAEYPAEWTYGADGRPTCTAFEPVSK